MKTEKEKLQKRLEKMDKTSNLEQNPPLHQTAVMCWVSVKDTMPTKDGQYVTYLQTSKYDSIGFTQFLDGQFMSSFVTHWMEVLKPCT